MNMKQVILPFALSAALVASADLTGLPDLTDDLGNRAAISGNDNIGNKIVSNGANAFDIIGDVATTISKDEPKDSRNNLRFGRGDCPLWVVYQFKTPTIVNAYRIWNQSSFGMQRDARTPKHFEFFGSKDGEKWVLLDKRENESAWNVNKEPYREYEFDNPVAYTYYKMNFLSPIVAGQYCIIQELEYFCRPIADDSIIVVGAPADYGSPTPSYGTLDAVLEQEYEMTIESPCAISDGQVAGCLGWKSYIRNAADPTVWDLKDSGAETSVSFTHPGGAVKWAWQFAVSNLIEVAVHGNGTVSVPNENWCEKGSTLSVCATAGEGYDFIRWIGDTTGIADVEKTDILVPADSPRKLTAFFIPHDANKVVYVSTEGDDANDGLTLGKATATVSAAVAALDQIYMEGTVFVAPGVYEQSRELTLSNAIEVVGMGGRPEKTVLRNVGNTGTSRVFVLRNKNARVVGVSMENGRVNDSFGGNVLLTAGGGTVSNCVIRSGYGVNVRGANIALNSADAVVTHCVISNGSLLASGEGAGVAVFVQGGGGRLSNCLITQNATHDNTLQTIMNNKQVSVVNLNGPALMDNCTIVDNCHTGLVSAVSAKSDAKSRVVNCVIARNLLADGTLVSAYSGGSDKFFNCVTDGAEPINRTCTIGTVEEMFVNANDRKWLPLPSGLLENVGTTNNLAVPSVDLNGHPRIRGDAIDAGCYEVAPAGFFIRIR